MVSRGFYHMTESDLILFLSVLLLQTNATIVSVSHIPASINLAITLWEVCAPYDVILIICTRLWKHMISNRPWPSVTHREFGGWNLSGVNVSRFIHFL